MSGVANDHCGQSKKDKVGNAALLPSIERSRHKEGPSNSEEQVGVSITAWRDAAPHPVSGNESSENRGESAYESEGDIPTCRDVQFIGFAVLPKKFQEGTEEE